MSGPLWIAALLSFGMFTGVLSGLLGIGGGIVMVPFLVLVGGLTEQVAQATSLLAILPTAVVGSAALHARGVGDLRMSLLVGVGGAAAGAAGAGLALALPAGTLRALFAAVLALVGLRLVHDGLYPHEGDAGTTKGSNP